MECRVHATCVALGGRALLIRGPSGAGKSDLALRFLSLAAGSLTGTAVPELVADDQVILTRRIADGGAAVIEARAPVALAGKIEVRGVGIVMVPARAVATVVALLDLAPASAIERIPDPLPTESLLGVNLRVYRLDPWRASAPMKLAVILNLASAT